MKPTSRGRSPSGSNRCATCKAPTEGQAQTCSKCRHAKTLCRTCKEPHGGPPATTKYCKKCRAMRRARPRHPQNPRWTEAEDAQIRQVYATCNARQIGQRLRELFLTRPRWSLKRRAQHIGCATVRKKEPRWSEAEDAILKECGWMTPDRVAVRLRERGFRRTITAICLRMRRSRLHEQIDGYTAQALAELFDVDVHKVLRWIRLGQLVGQRSGTTGDNHDRWYITNEAVRDFCFAYPEQVELTKIERVGSKDWYLDLITYGRTSQDNPGAPSASAAGTGKGTLPALGPAPATTRTITGGADRTVELYGEQVTLTALAQMSGKTVVDLLHRIDGLKMPPNKAAFGAVTPEQPAPLVPMVDGLGESLGAQLGALLKKHRCKPADVARWTTLPPGLIVAALSGEATLVSPALMRIVEVLDGEIAISITPKKR